MHKVHSGVVVYAISMRKHIGEKLMFSFTNTANMKFANLADKDIHSVIHRNKEPMDKAGSYGIQGVEGQFGESGIAVFSLLPTQNTILNFMGSGTTEGGLFHHNGAFDAQIKVWCMPMWVKMLPHITPP
jgi:hypothetical protein